MTTDEERSLVRFATPYLEVERQATSSLERTIGRELAQASHAAKTSKRRRQSAHVDPNQADAQ